MQDRKRKMKSPCEWLWWRNTLSFFSHFNGVLSRVETHKKMGRVLDWEKEFSPQWVSCIVLSRIFCILAARRRFVRVPKVYDTRRLALVNELVEYYAPCKCEESASFEDTSVDAYSQCIPPMYDLCTKAHHHCSPQYAALQVPPAQAGRLAHHHHMCVESSRETRSWPPPR